MNTFFEMSKEGEQRPPPPPPPPPEGVSDKRTQVPRLPQN